ncbi:MAG: transporter substrate-binding domain-containing protein [Sphaerochaeta sp.]|nr:transporter substrate-binding domain-containing protein [Sphaerochaeta sp.]
MINTRKLLVLLAIAGLLISLSLGCSKKETAADREDTVRTVQVAHTQSYVPYDYINEKGESDGFEVAVLKAVDALLPEFAFSYVGTSDDDLLIGIETGKYQLGTKGAWITEERKQKFIFPKHYIGASVIGITYRTSDAEVIRDVDSFAKFSGKLVPIAPQNAQYAIVEQYNAAHPEFPIKLVPSESFTVSDAYNWVLEGRYDAYFNIALSFQNNVLKEGAPYKHLADKLSYAPYRAIPTWPLFNKTEQALADAYDRAIEQLRTDGTIEKLSQQYFGEDIFKYIQE